jgi:hypothetical protein
MSQITPTPGRIIWYTPGTNDGITRNGTEPLAAIVAAVLADGTVNLAVFDARGNLSQRHAVELDAVPTGPSSQDRASHCRG